MKKNKDRDEKMKKMIDEQGLSYGSVALMFKVSRARVHQIVRGYSTHNLPREKYLEVLKRDKFACQWQKACGGKPVNVKDLVVFHINFNVKDNRLANLITVCRKCLLFFCRSNHIDEKVEKRLLKNNEKKVGKKTK